MIELHHPENEIELAVLRSLLESAWVHHYVHNDHFGTLRIGPHIPLLNRKTVMVAPQHLEGARTVLASYFDHASPAEETPKQTLFISRQTAHVHGVSGFLVVYSGEPVDREAQGKTAQSLTDMFAEGARQRLTFLACSRKVSKRRTPHLRHPTIGCPRWR